MALASATLLEIAAYYIPWLDPVLDTIATPAAGAAGILASASVITDLPSSLRWLLALIGGGGAAGFVQGASVLLRLKSAALAGGLGNPVVATGELAGALVISAPALVLPLLCLLMCALLCLLAFRSAGRVAFGRSCAEHSAA